MNTIIHFIGFVVLLAVGLFLLFAAFVCGAKYGKDLLPDSVKEFAGIPTSAFERLTDDLSPKSSIDVSETVDSVSTQIKTSVNQ